MIGDYAWRGLPEEDDVCLGVRRVRANVIGLPVTDGMIRVEDLIEWIEGRDAACAEYLVDALREYQGNGRRDVKEGGGE